MNHQAITTHTWSTDSGIKIVAEFATDRLQAISIQFPGSGQVAKPIALTDLKELAEITREAAEFLTPRPQVG
jgi:hypothetical protein